MSVCLDSWAVLAWLDGEEPALSRVNDLIGSRPVISWINLVEVYHRLERDHGREVADETAAAQGLVLLTGDPELVELRDAPCAVEDLRAT